MQLLASAPMAQLQAKTLLAGHRSAAPVSASSKEPPMKPSCVAASNHAKPDASNCQRAISPAAAPAGLNHNDVPRHCATTTTDTPTRRNQALGGGTG